MNPSEAERRAAVERATPTAIRKKGGERLTLEWKDGHVSQYEPVYLRERCPCARCVDEMTGRRTFGPGQADPGVSLRQVQIVGQYALQIEFTDGHGTGLYAFELLRTACPCSACATPPAAS